MDHEYTPGTALGLVTINSVTRSGVTVFGNQTLFASALSIGVNGPAAYQQSAFATALSLSLILGTEIGGNGTYRLSGTGILSVGGEYIGDIGRGSFIQSGGTHIVDGQLWVGAFGAGSSGSFDLSGGSLAVGGLLLAYYGGGANVPSTGTFTQSGGSVTVGTPSNNREAYIGVYGNGTYVLSDGSLTVNGREVIGNFGQGSFTQTGGTHTVTGNELISDASGGSGSYTHSGGTHTVGTPSANADLGFAESGLTNGSYSLSGSGSLTVYGNEYLGLGGTASFNHAGGTHLVTGTQIVGNTSTGTVTQSGGSHTVGTPSINGELKFGNYANRTGSYSLSGSGSLIVNGVESIGYDGVGTFTQSGVLIRSPLSVRTRRRFSLAARAAPGAAIFSPAAASPLSVRKPSATRAVARSHRMAALTRSAQRAARPSSWLWATACNLTTAMRCLGPEFLRSMETSLLVAVWLISARAAAHTPSTARFT
jgi:hypothetical protein